MHNEEKNTHQPARVPSNCQGSNNEHVKVQWYRVAVTQLEFLSITIPKKRHY